MLFRGVAAFFALTVVALADTGYAAAVALLKSHRLLEARDALQQLVATEPGNAAAWHQLGLLWRERGDTESFEKAVDCLQKAAQLDAKNETFLADYGGTAMELAGRTRSMAAAINGRDAMEKAVAMNPDDLDAREGLFQFYSRAPFFVGGSSAKAAAQLEEIRRRDPDRATVLAVIAKTDAKDYAAAFALCDGVLRRHPDDYTALYQYGRTASMSGQNLDRGLACLEHALQFEPPTPTSPLHTHIWYRIGAIQQKLGHLAEAKHAYETSVQLDPSNQTAANALKGFR